MITGVPPWLRKPPYPSAIKLQVTHFLALGRFLAARAAALWVDTEDQNSGGSRLGIHYIPLYAIIYHDIPLYTII